MAGKTLQDTDGAFLAKGLQCVSRDTTHWLPGVMFKRMTEGCHGTLACCFTIEVAVSAQHPHANSSRATQGDRVLVIDQVCREHIDNTVLAGRSQSTENAALYRVVPRWTINQLYHGVYAARCTGFA